MISKRQSQIMKGHIGYSEELRFYSVCNEKSLKRFKQVYVMIWIIKNHSGSSMENRLEG